MKFETRCPECGSIVKRESLNGRISWHGLERGRRCPVVRVDDDGIAHYEGGPADPSHP